MMSSCLAWRVLFCRPEHPLPLHRSSRQGFIPSISLAMATNPTGLISRSRSLGIALGQARAQGQHGLRRRASASRPVLDEFVTSLGLSCGRDGVTFQREMERVKDNGFKRDPLVEWSTAAFPLSHGSLFSLAP